MKHLPATALPGANLLNHDPAGNVVFGQVYGRRVNWWNPGAAYVINQLGYTPANKAGDTFQGDVIAGVAGAGFRIKEGTNARAGVATLAAGTATVATNVVTLSSRIILTGNGDNGGTPGWLRVSARSPGTSFTITSSSASDTSRVAWLIFEPAP